MKKIVFLPLFFACACILSGYEEEVTFENSGVTFGGTLALPDSVGRFPALVLVSGSGQQNRDSELFGFKSFKMLSDSLVRNGFAVLRYDDRGIACSASGKSTLDTSTTYTFANDALCAIRFLKTNEHINADKVGILGHSEGGLIADYLAAEHPSEIAFTILMAGPTVSAKKIVDFQVVDANKRAGLNDEELERVLSFQHRIYKAIEENQSRDSLVEILYESNLVAINFMPEEQRKSILDSSKYARFLAMQSVKSINSDWFRAFIQFKPEQYQRKINCPTLALFGEKDHQVPPSLNLDAIKSAFSDRPELLTINIIKDANHLFQKADTGTSDEYAKLKPEFAPGFFDAITSFLNKLK